MIPFVNYFNVYPKASPVIEVKKKENKCSNCVKRSFCAYGHGVINWKNCCDFKQK